MTTTPHIFVVTNHTKVLPAASIGWLVIHDLICHRLILSSRRITATPYKVTYRRPFTSSDTFAVLLLTGFYFGLPLLQAHRRMSTIRLPTIARHTMTLILPKPTNFPNSPLLQTPTGVHSLVTRFLMASKLSSSSSGLWGVTLSSAKAVRFHGALSESNVLVAVRASRKPVPLMNALRTLYLSDCDVTTSFSKIPTLQHQSTTTIKGASIGANLLIQRE